MAETVASSFKIVFVLLYFDATLFPAGIVVSILFAIVEMFHKTVSPLALAVHIVAYFRFQINRGLHFWLIKRKSHLLSGSFYTCFCVCKKSVIVELSGCFYFSLNFSRANTTFGFKWKTVDNPLSSSSDLSPLSLSFSFSLCRLRLTL